MIIFTSQLKYTICVHIEFVIANSVIFTKMFSYLPWIWDRYQWHRTQRADREDQLFHHHLNLLAVGSYERSVLWTSWIIQNNIMWEVAQNSRGVPWCLCFTILMVKRPFFTLILQFLLRSYLQPSICTSIEFTLQIIWLSQFFISSHYTAVSVCESKKL